MFPKFLLIALLIHMGSQAESIEDIHPFLYSQSNAVDFHDIFSYTNSLTGKEASLVSDIKDDEDNLNTVPNHQTLDINKTPPTRYIKSYPRTPKYDHNPTLNTRTEDVFSETTTETDVSSPSPITIVKRVYPSWMSISTTSTSTSTSTTTSTSTESPIREEIIETTETLPMSSSTKDPFRERGILDLLFPPRRVKTFKSMFDAIRNILSHTFKR